VLGLDIANYISSAFVGRIEDREIATEALRLLQVQQNVGYEAVLGTLSPKVGDGRRGAREFVVKDVSGHVEKVRIDLGHKPGLLEALDTTAKQPVRVEPRDSNGKAYTDLVGTGPVA
jgi:hypothetical protein